MYMITSSGPSSGVNVSRTSPGFSTLDTENTAGYIGGDITFDILDEAAAGDIMVTGQFTVFYRDDSALGPFLPYPINGPQIL